MSAWKKTTLQLNQDANEAWLPRKPTVATVPPIFTVRLAAMGKGLSDLTAFNKAKSLAASTFTTDATDDSKRAAWHNCVYDCVLKDIISSLFS